MAHLLGFSSAKLQLRPTETRVRHRDGSVSTETRDGGGFTRTEVQGATAEGYRPAYLADQEAGTSRLVPKAWDSAAARWVCAAGAAASGTAPAGKPAASGAAPALRLVSYNVWFEARHQHARARALFALLSAVRPAPQLICLQEVTPQFLGWLRDEEWVRDGYVLSDSIGTTLKGSFAYGVLMLVRRDVGVRALTAVKLPSQMNREALVAELELARADRGGMVVVRAATAHLESLDAAELRAAQLRRIFGAPLSGAAAAGEAGGAAEEGGDAELLLCGDMNFDDGAAEEACLPVGWQDLWRCVPADDGDGDAPATPLPPGGCTMLTDDHLGRPTRIDRVFSRCAQLVPSALTRIGMDTFEVPSEAGTAADASPITHGRPVQVRFEVPDASPALERPSDHLGLLCDFTFA